MEFNASVSVTFSKETAHRTVTHLKTTNGTGLWEFNIPQGTGPFHHIVEVVGVTRYHDAWSTAFERCEVQPIGSIELDDDDISRLASCRVAI